jgi:5-methylcytosine-specific restriction enzyme A
MMPAPRYGSAAPFDDAPGRAEKRLCRNCGKQCEGRRRNWCSDECVEEHRIRSWPTYARHKVHQRDHGICAICSLDCIDVARFVNCVKNAADDVPREVLERWFQLAWQEASTEVLVAAPLRGRAPRRWPNLWKVPAMQVLDPYGFHRSDLRRVTFWDVDHIQPVVEGGGSCNLDNLRSLCIPCHREVTAGLNRNRVKKGRKKASKAKARIPSRGFLKSKRTIPSRPLRRRQPQAGDR